MRIPIVPKYRAKVARGQLDHAKALAATIRFEQPRLAESEGAFRHLMIDSAIEDASSLHLDDFSEIPVIGKSDNSHILQQRARLRAYEGDFVALSRKVENGFSDYCEYKLGLGRVHWVYPSIEPTDTRQLAFECSQDRRVKHDLAQAIRHHDLRYIHPHVSTLHVWELADMLHHTTRRPVRVIGPTPALAGLANDKIEFSRAAVRLLGESSLPVTDSAYNFAKLSKKIHCLAATHGRIAIKFPYGVGGAGNFLIDAAQVREMTLPQTRDFLKKRLAGYHWPNEGRVLIDVWESDVISSPSVQTWIPPRCQGDPILEGLFMQTLVGDQGAFTGSSPLTLPDELEQKIINESFLLAVLFQELGYVGRCSFDLILTGEAIENCRVEFIECNARWGGTSIPMALANRLDLDPGQTYSIQKISLPGLDQIGFARLTRKLDKELYDANTGNGRFILFNPSRIKSHSAVDAMAIGNTTKEANRLLTEVLPARLQEIIGRVSK